MCEWMDKQTTITLAKNWVCASHCSVIYMYLLISILSIIITFRGRWYYCPHFIDEETGARESCNLLKVPQIITEQGIKPGHFGSLLLCPNYSPTESVNNWRTIVSSTFALMQTIEKFRRVISYMRLILVYNPSLQISKVETKITCWGLKKFCCDDTFFMIIFDIMWFLLELFIVY